MRSCQYVVATATGQVITGPCLLVGIVIHDTGGNTFLIYDAESATNLVLKMSQASAGFVQAQFPQPIYFSKGIYYSCTGANSTATFLIG